MCIRDRLTSEFICAASALETELLEDGKWSIHRQAVDIENTGLADHMMGAVSYTHLN